MNYLFAEDVMVLLKVSISMAYKEIQELNANLRKKGYRTINGKVPIKFFCETYYCEQKEVEKIAKDARNARKKEKETVCI